MMRRIFLGLAALVLCSAATFGQQTPVSATVIDPNGVPYNFASGYASIACPGNQQPTFNGSPLTRTITIVGFDGFGKFSMTLWDVGAIQPVGCGWQFMITWQDQITSFTTGIIGKIGQTPAITGSANVDLSVAISAFAPPLPSSAGGGGAATGTPSIQYVTTTGRDTSNGLTWGGAKLTIAAACAALPGGNSSCSAGSGIIYTYAVNSPNPFTPAFSTYFLPNGTSPQITLRIVGYTGEASSGPTPGNVIDFRSRGARPFLYPPNTITVTTNGTATVTTTGISDFQIADDIVIPAVGPATTQTTPAAPTVQTIGATGTNTVSYECVGLDAQWGQTAASPAGSTTNSPTVFGPNATQISSATWAANVVTVNTGIAMPFSSGTFHAVIANLQSSGNNIGGMRLVTMVSATQLTYALTGSGTVTLGTRAAVVFVNGFVLTQVSETKGSNFITLTTDVNHNLRGSPISNHPTKIYLDAISFPGEALPLYAQGVFTISNTTANTITVQTPYTATITQNAVPILNVGGSGIAIMSVLYYAENIVTCPSSPGGLPSNGAVQYAVYANYGSGFVPIGTTPYRHSTLVDYGPAYTQSGFIAPPAMNLPATPPVAAQRQVFEAKIINIVGSTLTIDRSVPASVAGTTGYHSSGIALQNAINDACIAYDGLLGQNNFYSVSMPTSGGFGSYYVFNAPVNLAGGSNNCAFVSVLQSSNIWPNGTLYSGTAAVEWKKPEAGFQNFQFYGGPKEFTAGYGNPGLALFSGNGPRLSGISFNPQSNGAAGLYAESSFTQIDNCDFVGGGALLSNSTMALELSGGFLAHLHNVFQGSSVDFIPPLASIGYSNYGMPLWWPVPTIEVMGSTGAGGSAPGLVIDGQNYGANVGIQIDSTYGGGINVQWVEIQEYATFQGPIAPLLMIEGSQVFNLQIKDSIGDSNCNATVANLGTLNMMHARRIANACGPGLSGIPPQATFSLNDTPVTQIGNTQMIEISQAGVISALPIYANGGLFDPANPYENCNRANGAIASNWVALVNSFDCNGSQIRQHTISAPNNMLWNGIGPSNGFAPQFAQVTLTAFTSNGLGGPAIYENIGGSSNGGQFGYMCQETTTTLSINGIGPNGSPLAASASTPIAGVPGDRVRIEGFQSSITLQITVNCYLNSAPPAAPTLTFTTTGPGQTAQIGGYPGLFLQDTTLMVADNWSGGPLPMLGQTNAEEDWMLPQHFLGPVTIGVSNPVAGALAANSLYVPNIVLATGMSGGGVQGTDSKVMSSGTVTGTGTTLCTDANGGATTSGCVATTAIQSQSFTSLGGNVSVGNTATTIMSLPLTMPSSGCPCRVRIDYGLYLDFPNTNVTAWAFWVNDGTAGSTHTLASLQTDQSNGSTGARTSGNSGAWTQLTYSNNAAVTFTLFGQGTGATTMNVEAAPQVGSGTNSWMSAVIATSN